MALGLFAADGPEFVGNPYRISGPTCISFSGGRTSGLMLWHYLDAHGGTLPAETHVVFANTGKEHPDTLAFVQKCSDYWSVPIAWVEYDGNDGERDFRLVDCFTASRDGEPFETLIQRKNALPNLTMRWCTESLKVRRARAYMRSLGYEHWTDCVGLRADEPRRVAKRRAASDDEVTYALPLDDAGVTVEDVRAFWRAQPFDLEIPSESGNCTLCMMKGPAILIREIRRDPAEADWWIEMERRTRRSFFARWNFRELRDAALVPIEQLTGRPRALALADPGEIACACTD